MTDYETAQIRLRAWKSLDGWGTTEDEESGLKVWGWRDRLKFAAQLADWAMTQPDGDQGEGEECTDK